MDEYHITYFFIKKLLKVQKQPKNRYANDIFFLRKQMIFIYKKKHRCILLGPFHMFFLKLNP